MPASSRSYSIIEPHPSTLPRAYLTTGRGGAGNITRAPANLTKGASAQGPPSRIHLHSSVSSSTSTSSDSGSSSASASTQSSARRVVHSGRGGLGNIHPATERAIFSFDEELERQLSQDRHAAPVYHVGRGGAGNISGGVSGVSAYPKYGKRSGSRSSDDGEEGDRRSEKSVGSVESGADVATRKVLGGLRKVWRS